MSTTDPEKDCGMDDIVLLISSALLGALIVRALRELF